MQCKTLATTFDCKRGKNKFMFCLLFGIYLTLAHGEGAEILCEEIHENVYTLITAYKCERKQFC